MNPTNMMPAPNQQPSPDQPFPLPTERWTETLQGQKWYFNQPIMQLQGQIVHTQSKYWSDLGLPKSADVLERHEEKRFRHHHIMWWRDLQSSFNRLAVGSWGHFGQGHGSHHQGWCTPESFWNQPFCFVQIHNTNNENAWTEVLKWERFHRAECPEPQVGNMVLFFGFGALVFRFHYICSWKVLVGKPKIFHQEQDSEECLDIKCPLTGCFFLWPILNWPIMLRYPFLTFCLFLWLHKFINNFYRHDWIVDRNGTEVR